MNDIVLTQQHPERYQGMMQAISKSLPSIAESSQSFYKSDSQLKIVSLDITELTDIGAAKHLLARIERKKQALKDSDINIRRKKIELAKLHEKYAEASGYEAEEIGVNILEIESFIEDTANYQRGALREMAFLVKQYELILQKIGVDVITEEMFENDQPKSHTIRAFSQALAAARARNGVIDEGNFIFFQDLGINGAAAQREMIAYLKAEQELIEAGQLPTFEMQYNWLHAVADKFSGEVKRYAEARGFLPLVEDALAQPKRIDK
jgi:hypothetical protein